MRTWPLVLLGSLLLGCGSVPTRLAPQVLQGPAPTPSAVEMPPSPPPVSPVPTPTATPRFQRFPVVLSFTPRAARVPDFVAAVEAASRTWNTALGETLFVTAPADGCPVEVDLLERGAGTDAAVGVVDGTHRPHWMHLFYPYLISPEPRRQTIALHEEGHLLGLTHSEDARDVMYERVAMATGLSAQDIARARKSVTELRAEAF